MTNLTRVIGLILTATVWVASAAAEDLPLPGTGESMTPPDLSLPALDDNSQLMMTAPEDGEGSVLAIPNAPLDMQTLDGYDPNAVPGFDAMDPQGHDFWMNYPAPIESTSTWLRRGFWYAEADAVVWNRHWNRDNQFMAAQDPNIQSPVFFEPQVLGGLGGRFGTNRVLMLDGAQPGEDASVRMTLGHFLFRDSGNRDHTTEFTVLGGGDWHQHRQLSSANNFGLFVNFLIDGGNRSFDGSTTQIVDYSSHYSSFEWNYRVKQRLRRDQLVMDANGNWHRATNPGYRHDYLIGLRIMEMRDIFNWRAEDIQALGNDGSYFIRTDNDMFGFQLGTGFAYETSRWSLGLETKGGVFLNDALGRTTLNFTVDDTSDADQRLTNDELSFIGEAKLIARYNILPDFALRASYEMMYITNQALGPNQATFVTDYTYLNTTQDPFYHGASFGFEGYW